MSQEDTTAHVCECSGIIDVTLVRAAVRYFDEFRRSSFLSVVQHVPPQRTQLRTRDDLLITYFLLALCRQLKFEHTFYPISGMPHTLLKVLTDAARCSLMPPGALDQNEFDRVIDAMIQAARHIIP